MPDITDLYSGGGIIPQPIDQRIVFSSMTYVAPVSGTLAIHAFAADGSPGLTYGSGCATGAGAGENGIKLHPVNAGDSIVITLGAGGPSVTRYVSGYTNGNDGGNTTITGPNGLNVLLMGGKGGKAGPVTAGASLLGGEGGIGGYGADLHRPGGRGGNIDNCNNSHQTGGGALNGTNVSTTSATRAGDVTGTPTGQCRTGGGGYGGRGGDLLSTSGSSPGGGTGGDALDGSTASGRGGPNILGQRSATGITLLNNATAPFGINATGCGADGGSAAGDGGGGVGDGSGYGLGGAFGGIAGYSANPYATPTPPAFYGAPGGVTALSGSAITLKGRDGFAILRLYPRG